MYQQRQFYRNNRAITVASWLLILFCAFLAVVVIDVWFLGGRYLFYPLMAMAAGSGETVIAAPPSQHDQANCSGVAQELEAGWIDSCNQFHEWPVAGAPAPDNNQNVVFSHEVTPLPPDCETNYQYFDDYWIDGCGNVQQYAAAGQRPEAETAVQSAPATNYAGRNSPAFDIWCDEEFAATGKYPAVACTRYRGSDVVPPEPVNTNDDSVILHPDVAARSWDESWEMFGPDTSDGALVDYEYFAARPEEFGDGGGTCSARIQLYDHASQFPAMPEVGVTAAWLDEFACHHEGYAPADYHLPVWDMSQ